MKPGTLNAEFGGEDCDFRLGIGELRELQERTNKGPEEVLTALRSGSWHTDDISETIRIGLIGAGVEPAKAKARVLRYVDEIPNWLDNKVLAFDIVMSALAPLPGAKKKVKARAKPNRSKNGTSKKSTKSAAP